MGEWNISLTKSKESVLTDRFSHLTTKTQTTKAQGKMEANHKMSLDYLGQKMQEVMCLFSLSLAALAVHAYS